MICYFGFNDFKNDRNSIYAIVNLEGDPVFTKTVTTIYVISKRLWFFNERSKFKINATGYFSFNKFKTVEILPMQQRIKRRSRFLTKKTVKMLLLLTPLNLNTHGNSNCFERAQICNDFKNGYCVNLKFHRTYEMHLKLTFVLLSSLDGPGLSACGHCWSPMF